MNKNDQFSEREKEVVALLLQGKSNKQIAFALGIAASTVEYHLKNIYRKLQVSSRTEAVLLLGKSTGDYRIDRLGKSIVEINGEKAENGFQPISTRRISMHKKFVLLSGGLLALAIIVMAVFINKPASNTAVQALLTSTPVAVPTSTQIGLPTLTPVVMEASVKPSEYIEYIVVPGDTCETIAANFNVSVEDILEKNDLSPSCILTDEQKLLIPFSISPAQLYETSNDPPSEFLGEWVNVDLATANMARVAISLENGEVRINMFGVCQPTECNFLEYSPTPTMDFTYDVNAAVLNVMWVFDFEILTQELTITSDGQLKVVTQNHYLDNSGREDFKTVEYFSRE